ncbi:MAG TPA: sialidase family protein [Candidatus Thermoplasmatota archaeon]|nr:sialidase family protein [Candidatus Thermoplasmatota archaeon]
MAAFRPATVVAAETEGDSRFTPGATCGGLAHGHGRVGPDGTAYLPRVYCDVALLHVSRDGGITWREIVVDKRHGGSPSEDDNHESRVAIDAAGNVYYFWIGKDWRPRLSVSRDGGATWSTPVDVAPARIGAARLPAIAAGSEGRIAFLYLANTTEAPGEWHAYVGVSVDALAQDPLVATVRATQTLLGRDACLEECERIGDFLDIAVSPLDGGIWVALADPCADACETLPPEGAAWGPVAVQARGVALAAGQARG